MKYLLIGNGRVAKHFRHYFTLLGLDFLSWHRGQDQATLQSHLSKASHVLLLISDSAIEPFIRETQFHDNQVLIHCSGSLVTDLAFCAHPLNTFTNELYDLNRYESVPFIVDADAPDFSDLLPGLPNESFRLEKMKRPKYHALCVMSGNFTTLLWQKAFSDFEAEFQLPSRCLQTYLKSITDNLMNNPKGALTGPLARGDQAVIQNNLDSLSGDPFQAIYQAFVNTVKPEVRHENDTSICTEKSD